MALTRYSLLFADRSARPAGFAESARRDWSLAYLVSHSNLGAVTWICVAASFISTDVKMCLVVSQQETTTALMPLASLRYLQSVRGKRGTEVTVHTCRVAGVDLLCGFFFHFYLDYVSVIT